MKDRVVGKTGHPAKSLRCLPFKSRKAHVTHRSLASSEGRERNSESLHPSIVLWLCPEQHDHYPVSGHEI